MPALIGKYQKQEAVTKLKRFYSVMNEAVKFSELENGNVSEWDSTRGPWNDDEVLNWYNKYLAKYIKTTKVVKKPPHGINIYFADGSIANINNYGLLDIHFITKNKTEDRTKNYFYFKFRPYENTKNLIVPYGFDIDRDTLINDSTHGCNNTNSASTQVYCSMLIMNDGWEIRDDYPW